MLVLGIRSSGCWFGVWFGFFECIVASSKSSQLEFRSSVSQPLGPSDAPQNCGWEGRAAKSHCLFSSGNVSKPASQLFFLNNDCSWGRPPFSHHFPSKRSAFTCSLQLKLGQFWKEANEGGADVHFNIGGCGCWCARVDSMDGLGSKHYIAFPYTFMRQVPTSWFSAFVWASEQLLATLVHCQARPNQHDCVTSR